jgi:hypothetical protein
VPPGIIQIRGLQGSRTPGQMVSIIWSHIGHLEVPGALMVQSTNAAAAHFPLGRYQINWRGRTSTDWNTDTSGVV